MRVQNSISSSLWGVYERRRICSNGHRLLTIETPARTIGDIGVRARDRDTIAALDPRQLRADGREERIGDN